MNMSMCAAASEDQKAPSTVLSSPFNCTYSFLKMCLIFWFFLLVLHQSFHVRFKSHSSPKCCLMLPVHAYRVPPNQSNMKILCAKCCAKQKTACLCTSRLQLCPNSPKQLKHHGTKKGGHEYSTNHHEARHVHRSRSSSGVSTSGG